MRPKLSVLILSGVSAVMGLGLLGNSVWALDTVLHWFNTCETREYPDIETGSAGACGYFQYWVAASSIGISAGVLQILSFGLPWLGRPKTWCLLHLLICVLSMASFSIGADWYGFRGWQVEKLVVLTVVSMLDMIFALPAAIAMFFMDALKKK